MRITNKNKPFKDPATNGSPDQGQTVLPRRSGKLGLLILLVVLVVLGGGTAMLVLNPALLERLAGMMSSGTPGVTSEPTPLVEFEPVATAEFNSGTISTLPPAEPGIAALPEPDPAIVALEEKYIQLDERIAIQSSNYLDLLEQIDVVKTAQTAIQGQLAEITTRLATREPIDMDIIKNMVSRQTHLENRFLEGNHQLATSIDAVVGSLSLVKQNLARQEDLIAALSSDLYLLSRYGYGNETQPGSTSYGDQRGVFSTTDNTDDSSPPMIRRGDYRVGDWIQGYGEVLSIHRTVEGDHLTTENGEVFAKARPDENVE